MSISRVLELISRPVVSQPPSIMFLSLTNAGAKACVTPRAGVSLNVDVAKADTPEDPLVEKTVAVCQHDYLTAATNCLQEITAPIESQCFNFGPTGSVGLNLPTPSGSSSSIAHTPTPSSTPYTSPRPSTTSSYYSHYTTTSSYYTSTSSSTPLSSSATVSPYHHYRRHNHRRHHGM